MNKLLALGLLLVTEAVAAGPADSPAYPASTREPLVETIHGTPVSDPWRWLEGDVRTQPRVAAWVAAQNVATDAYLATLPKREAIRARLTELYDYERISLPIERGQRRFYRRNSGLQNQSVLELSEGDLTRILIDPNAWAKDGADALAEWSPSPDGKTIAYAVQTGGSDWRVIKTLDVDTGKENADLLDWVKFTDIAWNADSSGFYYSRHPETPEGKSLTAAVFDHSVWFHRLGTPQSADRLVLATPENRGYYNGTQSEADGHWLVLRSSTGSEDRYELRALDTSRPDATVITLDPARTDDWIFAGAQGDTLYFVTNKNAPRYRLVAFDKVGNGGSLTPRTVVAEGADRMTGASIIGDWLLVAALKDARTEVSRYRLDGTPAGKVPLPGLGTAAGFEAAAGARTAFFAFTSYNAPTTIYNYNADTNSAVATYQPKVAFNPADYVVEQRFFTSKDGTKVPMFVSHRKDLDLSKGAPTLMYGYGGFNINILPAFQIDALAWMEMGGIYAEVTLRGGGEYGTAWHEAGRKLAKQNVFDDFIAGGEYLIASGLTPKGGLAIQGGSNGGLLVGAVINQRPDLFAAGLPAVGVMDMLRFPLFTEGRTWTDDYGDPEDPVQFKNLYGYSPYHNIKAGKPYPAILVTTADTDDRVVPGHSFKYAAALQAATIGPKPHLIRIETRAGHGSGKPTDKAVAEITDLWSFAGYWTGLTR